MSVTGADIPRTKNILAFGVLGLLGAAIPFLPSTQIRAVDRILFSPLAVVPAVAGFICGFVAILLGVRSWRRSHAPTRWNIAASILGIGCGAIAILVSVAAFFI